MLADAQLKAVGPVSDLQAALRFYVDTLGLSVLERVGDRDGGREARLGAAVGSLTIYESEAAGGSGATLGGFLVGNLAAGGAPRWRRSSSRIWMRRWQTCARKALHQSITTCRTCARSAGWP